MSDGAGPGSAPRGQVGQVGQVVVVTGGSSGIGLATARAFAGRGARLVLAARGESALHRAADACRAAGAASVLAVRTDIRCDGDVVALVERVVAEHGRIDVVVHSAAVMAYGTVEQVPVEVFRTVVDTTLHGTVSLAHAVLPVFRRQHKGVLIVVNSLVGSIVAPQMGAYATAKWGQTALIRALQLETRDAPDIHVCTVIPGGVNTPIYDLAANYTGRVTRPPIPVDSPRAVAAAVLRCADRPRSRVSVGLTNPLIIAGFRLMPVVFDALVGPLFRIGALGRSAAAPGPGNVDVSKPDANQEFGRWPSRWSPRRD